MNHHFNNPVYYSPITLLVIHKNTYSESFLGAWHWRGLKKSYLQNAIALEPAFFQLHARHVLDSNYHIVLICIKLETLWGGCYFFNVKNVYNYTHFTLSISFPCTIESSPSENKRIEIMFLHKTFPILVLFIVSTCAPFPASNSRSGR